MLTRAVCLAIVSVLLSVGCGRQPEPLVARGNIGLQLSELNQEDLSIALVNRSAAAIKINSLFNLGSVQSSIDYEIDGNTSALRRSRNSIPHFVDPAQYEMVLRPGALYGVILSKKHFAALHGLASGECYTVRAAYRPKSTVHAVSQWYSRSRRICF